MVEGKSLKLLIQMGDSYPDESPCSKRMRTFYDVFTENGDEVVVLAPYNHDAILDYPGAVYCRTIPLRKKNSLYRFLNSYLFGITSFLKAMTIKNVDVVLTTAPPPLINKWGKRIAKFHKAKLVYDVRDIWPDVAWEMGALDRKSIYSRIFEGIRDKMLECSDLIIAVSPGKVEKLKKYAPDKTILEITNGLDEEFLKNDEDRELVDKYMLDDVFTVCYMGNLGLAQGLKQLLRLAFKAQENDMNVQFLLFGSGAEEKILKDYVKEKGLNNVTFPGRIPNKHMFTVLKHSKISFVSLVNENLKDSVPTKMYEAIGVGCPVLLAASGDSAEILKKSGLGIAVEPNDDRAIWEAFSYMHDNINLYEAKKQYAMEYILSNYSRQKAAEVLETELHRMIYE